jgi:soluble lytic murein transglycosylase-like protein
MLRIWLLGVAIGLSCCINWAGAAPIEQPEQAVARLHDVDPAKMPLPLDAAKRSAAHALGKARRLVGQGKTGEARAMLAPASEVPELAGYAELIRVHLLMKEGSHREAYRTATEAIDRPGSEALHAALRVLQGETLAMGGDLPGAERIWTSILADRSATDESVRHSLSLSIVASRQRIGSLDAGVDPLVLLDQRYAEVAVATPESASRVLSPSTLLANANAAFDRGRTERAIDLFDQAIAGGLDGELVLSAKMGRARSLFRARRYAEALTAYRALLPDVEARFWYARSLARLGRIDESIVEFERVSGTANAEYASWALYLMGTLHEDRDELGKAIAAFRRASDYRDFPSRVRNSLWREGWAEYRNGAHAAARRTFAELEAEIDDPIARLRPRYWSARAAVHVGQEKPGRVELERIAKDFPLTYYGWRAQERLSLPTANLFQSADTLVEGTSHVDDETIERVVLLIEADLDDLARDELRFAARDARGYADRTRIGLLLARVGDYHRANRLVLTAYADSLARGLQPKREVLWWLAWPPAYRDLIDGNIDSGISIEPALVWAIMREESHYQVDARSSAGALGLLQLMPETAAQLAEEANLESFETEDLFDPKTNIRLGSIYLSQLHERFDGRLSAAIGSYNAGPRSVSNWLSGGGSQLEDDVWVENIPYDQTRKYVKRVLRSLHTYKVFYGAK